MFPLISIVIPNINGIKYLPDCLSSIQKQTFKDFEVIVIDNGSTDGSTELIKRDYPWVRLIELSENIGFAAACNKGIKVLRGRYVVTLNNDTVVELQWLEELWKAMEEDKNVGMVASKILLDKKTREIDSVGMLIYPDGIARQKGRGEIDKGQFDNENDILFPSACAAMYRKEMLEDVGLFDEDFFAYLEDVDLGLRGRLAHWQAVLAPGAVVYHKYSATGGEYSTFKALHVERNRLWTAVKNFPWTWLCMLPFYTLWRYAVQLYGAILGKGSTAEFKKLYSIKDIISTAIKAYTSALKNMPLMIKKRRVIKRKISNREFTEILTKHKITAMELILKD